MTPIPLELTKQIARKNLIVYHEEGGFGFPMGSIVLIEASGAVFLTGLFDLDLESEGFWNWLKVGRPADPQAALDKAVAAINKMPHGEAKFVLMHWPTDEGLLTVAKLAGLEILT